MPVIKHNDNRVNLLKIENDKIYLDGVKVKKNDVLGYRCDYCGHSEEIKLRSSKNFINNKINDNKIICSKCLRKKTNLSKYGVENLSQSPEIQEKIKQNSLEKYGTKHFLSSKEVRDKIGKTNLEKYGNENIFDSKEIKEKIKQTMKKKYGVEYSLQSDKIKNKFYKSMVEKYGTQYAMHSFQIREKRRNSMQSNIQNKIFDFEHITPLFEEEEFIGINKFYKWKCNTCYTTFEDHLDYGHIPRCPRCNPKKVKIDRKQKELVKWLKTILNIKNIVEEDKNIISPDSVNIYLPEYHIAIDLISLYWHSESQGRDRNHQINKTALCASRGVDLITIFEDEWMIKQKIIKSIIKQKLGLFGKSLNIKNCFVKEITNKDASFFYERNHLQGHVNSRINYGLFHQTEGLVSCFSISRARFNQHYEWEITRFTNRMNFYISDAFETFLNHFKEQNRGSIITYADCRYFDASIYEKNGFINAGRSEPNYFYTNYLDRHNRLQFQKNRLEGKLKYFDGDLTEWQNMQMNGWDRVWDCGSEIYTLE